MKLYEIQEALLKLKIVNEKIMEAEENGEDISEIKKELENNFMIAEVKTEEKMEGVVKIIKNMESKIAAFEKEMTRMQKRKKTLENQITNIKEWLIRPTLEAYFKNKIDAGLFIVSFRESSSVEIIDELLIPCLYKKAIETVEIDKLKIRQDLKQREIPGAKLKYKKSVSIR